jgi:hypothetical protein
MSRIHLTAHKEREMLMINAEVEKIRKKEGRVG